MAALIPEAYISWFRRRAFQLLFKCQECIT